MLVRDPKPSGINFFDFSRSMEIRMHRGWFLKSQSRTSITFLVSVIFYPYGVGTICAISKVVSPVKIVSHDEYIVLSFGLCWRRH